MQTTSVRVIVVIILLIGGVLAVYQSSRPNQSPSLASPDFTYVADIDFWQRTEREQIVRAHFPLDLTHEFNEIPLQLGDWQGQDIPQTNLKVFILLEPDQFLQRRYQNSAGQIIWLTLIGGRQTQSFHPVDLCYSVDGWQTALTAQTIQLDSGSKLYGLWLEAQKQPNLENRTTEHRVFYFYLFPDSKRDQANGIVLVRLTTPDYGSIAENINIQRDFLNHLFQ